MSDLMQKLAVAKKIMDKNINSPRNSSNGGLPLNENINATYNIPDNILPQQPQQPQPQPQQPQPQQTYNNNGMASESAIQNSKLPDDIKRLMLENPITQPNSNGGQVLSNEIIEGAARLMGNNTPKPIDVSQVPPNQLNETVRSNTDTELRQMIRDVVRDTVKDVIKEELTNAGLISESTKKTNEILSLRVGNHIFEGKVLKIRKVKQ